jgi:hypothetical protein
MGRTSMVFEGDAKYKRGVVIKGLNFLVLILI